MCGLAAAILKKPISKTVIKNTMSSLRNRGPDNQQFKEFRMGDYFIYLIHSRLSIIDLSDKSNQPFEYKNLNIIFNGEIYNHLEIKCELENAGYNFDTSSDTEVLIKSIDHFGIKNTLRMLDGMFAFICYNSNTHEIIVARDRFGEKPLYYYSNGDEVYFASETRVLKIIADKKFEVNYEKIYNFLKYGYRAINLDSQKGKFTSFFNKIFEFKKSHYAKFSIKETNFEEKKYWELKNNINFQDLGFEEAKKYLKNLLIHTIESRFFADVPVAYFQSGGVDSNLIATIAKNELNLNLTGFYMSNSDSRYSEDILVQDSSSANKNNIIKLNVDDERDFIGTISNQINYQDAPIFTTVDYCMFKLAQKIKKENFKVVLTGSGADEVFTGYFDHYLLNFNDLNLSGQKDKYKNELDVWKNEILPSVRNPSFQSEENFKKSKLKYLFQNDGVENLFVKNSNFEFSNLNFGFSNLRNRMCNELFVECIPPVLFQDDLNCMYHSIENRSPYLSHNLVEFGYSINQNYHINNGALKNLLRIIGLDYLDLKAFKNKQKVGFNYPTEKMINFKSNDISEFVLSDSQIFDFIKKDELKKIVNSDREFTNNESKTLFSIISAKMFLDNNE